MEECPPPARYVEQWVPVGLREGKKGVRKRKTEEREGEEQEARGRMMVRAFIVS